MAIHLVKPNTKLLPSYLEAIQEGKYCNMAVGFGDDTLSEIMEDTDSYLRKVADPAPWKAKLPNGSEFAITEHVLYWITDGNRFIGSLPLRYAGDLEVIENYCGHIGMAIRPSLLNRGYGVRALVEASELGRAIAKEKGFIALLATCDQNNTASRRLIEHAGGKFLRTTDDFNGSGPLFIYQFGG
jgi:predicted acetyltransferase